MNRESKRSRMHPVQPAHQQAAGPVNGRSWGVSACQREREYVVMRVDEFQDEPGHGRVRVDGHDVTGMPVRQSPVPLP